MIEFQSYSVSQFNFLSKFRPV